jgi:metal-sulfur cluster biosynthetic enzyme
MTDAQVTKDQVTDALRDVEDPELPISVVDLGLLRGIEIDGNSVTVKMTFTSVACPCTYMISEDVENRLRALQGVDDVHVEEVFETWTRDDVSPEGRTVLSTLAMI